MTRYSSEPDNSAKGKSLINSTTKSIAGVVSAPTNCYFVSATTIVCSFARASTFCYFIASVLLMIYVFAIDFVAVVKMNLNVIN